MTKKKRSSFEEAKRQYVHRFTMEHIPNWARAPHFHTERKEWVYYAPTFSSDREWYDNTTFPPDTPYYDSDKTSCYSTGQTWPLGKGFLDEPFAANKNQRAK